MNVDCQWVDSNLEFLLSDQLDANQKFVLEHHLDTCERCRMEIESYTRVDRLIGAYMDQQTDRAYATPRQGFSNKKLATAAIAAASLLAVVLWPPSAPNQPVIQTHSLAKAPPSEIPKEVANIDKATDAARSERAKLGVDGVPEKPAGTAVASMRDVPESTDPRFYVTDQAGYFHSLDDFLGSALVFAVFDGSYLGATMFQQVYDSYNSIPNLLILGVTNDAGALRPTGITFPLMNNRRSALLGTRAGEFVVIDADGAIHRRGSLSDESLIEELGSILQELGL